MLCPKCGRSKSRVVDTRRVGDERIERIRQCLGCGHPWSTVEREKGRGKTGPKLPGEDEDEDRHGGRWSKPVLIHKKIP
jgi:hypothetical protein